MGRGELFSGSGEVSFDNGFLGGIKGRSFQHSEMARGFEVLIESAGIEFLGVELFGKLQRGVQRDESGVEIDGGGWLEGGVGFFLELLELGQIGAQGEGARNSL